MIPSPEGGWITRQVSLKYEVVLALGEALGAPARMLAELLPDIESAIVRPDDGLSEGEADDDA